MPNDFQIVVRIPELDRFWKFVKNLDAKRVRTAYKSALAQSGSIISYKAKQTAPVETGRLRASIGIYDERYLVNGVEPTFRGKYNQYKKMSREAKGIKRQALGQRRKSRRDALMRRYKSLKNRAEEMGSTPRDAYWAFKSWKRLDFGTRVPYAAIVHEGWGRRKRPNPYMIRAINASMRRLERVWKVKVEDLLYGRRIRPPVKSVEDM